MAAARYKVIGTLAVLAPVFFLVGYFIGREDAAVSMPRQEVSTERIVPVVVDCGLELVSHQITRKRNALLGSQALIVEARIQNRGSDRMRFSERHQLLRFLDGTTTEPTVMYMNTDIGPGEVTDFEFLFSSHGETLSQEQLDGAVGMDMEMHFEDPNGCRPRTFSIDFD